MTRTYPDQAAVLAELEELRHQAQSTGTRVSVLALARRVSLSHTTFRRRFPDVTARIIGEERAAATSSAVSAATVETEAKLRQRNRDLQENLALAITVIQRLTLENERLRSELESARAITSIRSRRPTDDGAPRAGVDPT